jgi:hypothetical protein
VVDRSLFTVNYLWSIIYFSGRMAKAKISVTIDGDLAKEIDAYLRKLVVEAAKSGKSIPKQSNIYEDIVRRGWESMKKEKDRK